jgi:Sec-independent protein translocase protein TatA
MGEITIILLLALIFLGPKKLPELASGLGKLIREIRKTTSDVKNEIQLDEIIRKPMEELREAMTLHPDELKRRDRMKAELAELQRQAEAAAAAADEIKARITAEGGDFATMADNGADVGAGAGVGAAGDAPPVEGQAPGPDQTTVDAHGAGTDAAANVKTPAPVATVPGTPAFPSGAPAGTIARDPSGVVSAAHGQDSAGHAPPAPPLAAVLARGSGARTAEKGSTSAGTDFLRSLRAVPDARPATASRPNPVVAPPPGAADRSNTTQTLTEADLAAITVGGPPPPPAPTGHTGKTQPPPPPARLPGATPPKSSNS